MNWEQIKGIVERIATFAIAWAAGKGYIPAGVVGDLTALVVLVGAVVWGWKSNTATSIVKAAESIPEVKSVKVTEVSGIADAGVTGPKVTT